LKGAGADRAQTEIRNSIMNSPFGFIRHLAFNSRWRDAQSFDATWRYTKGAVYAETPT
jgi:hypothetical protein